MTKPGNSDPAEPNADKAVPDDTAPEEDATSSLAPEPADTEPEKPETQEKAEPEPEPEPAPKPKARPAKPKIEKAPPVRADEPVMPTAREVAARRAQAGRRFEEPPPRTLRFSFYFLVASGLIWLASMVASLIYKQDIIDAEIERNNDPSLSADQIANGVTQILWIVTIAAITFTVFLGLFGYKATEGTRRARTLVTIFGTVLVLFHLLLNGTPPGILSAMFCLVGLALLWSPSARRYFAPRELR